MIVGIFLAMNYVETHVSVNVSSNGSDWTVSMSSSSAIILTLIRGLSINSGLFASTITEGRLPPSSSWNTC